MTIITDRTALAAVSPDALSAYATTEGWTKIEKFGDKSFIYAKERFEELIIPSTNQLGDYSEVVAALLGILSKAEGRDQAQIYRDLVGANRDVIRLRVPNANEDGSIGIESGVGLFGQSRVLLEAAACSATGPRPSYRAGSVKRASDYMSQVYLGQTEQGSFIVTLLAPVPPSLERPEQIELWPALAVEPFERLVTRRLAQGLEAARLAAEHTNSGSGFSQFTNAVQQGVSANLCEALAALIVDGAGLEVSITWARTRPTPESRRVIRFSNSDSYVFREAARLFRSREERPGETIVGYVKKLDRDIVEDDGKVVIRTFIDGKVVSVTTILPPELYSIALKANDEKQGVRLTGNLRLSRQRWQLDATDLVVLDELDDDDQEAA